MTLATAVISFSRPESEVICSYLASAGIPAMPGERHHATCSGDYLVAQGGIRIQVPETLLGQARELLAQMSEPAELSESRAFARHYLANALILLLAFTTFGGAYFPYWLRAQREMEVAETLAN